MASGGGASEAIESKVSVLKVSIHCEGCKRKVFKILRKIEGVDAIEIDARQNKVTVKAPVDAQTLIHKLKKSGKHAELWHEKRLSDHSSGNHHNKNESRESSKSEEQTENTKSAAASPIAAKQADVDEIEAVDKSSTGSKETKAETKTSTSKELPKADEKSAEKSKPPTETTETAVVNGAENAPASSKASGGSSNSEEMGKKSHKHSNAEIGLNPHPAFPPQQAYVMSYNMARPSISQPYYVSPPPPPPSQGYTFVDPYPPSPGYYYTPVDANSSASVHQQDPYNNMFSDENPNACSLM